MEHDSHPLAYAVERGDIELVVALIRERGDAFASVVRLQKFVCDKAGILWLQMGDSEGEMIASGLAKDPNSGIDGVVRHLANYLLSHPPGHPLVILTKAL